MSLEVLKKFAEESGNEEVVKVIGDLEQSFKNNNDRLGTLEKDLKDAITKRDSVRNLVKTKLGLEELTEENIDKALSAKKTDDSEYTRIIEDLKKEKDLLLNDNSTTKNQYNLEKQLIALSAPSETASAKAYDIVLKEILKSATFEGDNIVFKKDDGTTIRNSDGSQYSLADKYREIKESEDMSFLFTPKRSKSGSGSQKGTGEGAATLRRGSMTHSEKGKYIEKHGQAAYLALPN